MSTKQTVAAPRALRRSVTIALTALVIVLGLMGPQGPNAAQATGSLTPGVAGPVTVTTTVPAFGNSPGGGSFDFGTNANQYQVLTIHMQLVLKTASALPWPSWTWGSPDAAAFVNSTATPQYCTSVYSCSRSGAFAIAVTRSGSPVTFTPWYFARAAGLNDVTWNLNDQVTPPAGTIGLQAGDTLSVTLKDGYLNLPASLDDYEFRFVYEAVQLGTGTHGPTSAGAASSAGPASVPTAAAPSAVAGAGGATITPVAVSPTPASYLITASPQVGGVTKTCTVTPPATSCTITGLTVGENYTFTTVVTPLDGIAGGESSASSSVTPFAAPGASSISPTVGSTVGGERVTITGSNFEAGATVKIGNEYCTDVTVVSATEITCTTPARTAGVKSINVTNSNGGYAWLINGFTYVVAPTVEGITTASGSASGPVGGGTEITITGTNFVAGATVTVGGAPCSPVTVVSATQITCTTPAGTAGTADVVVSNADGGVATSAGAFTYVADPVTPDRSSLPSTGVDTVVPVGIAAVVLVVGLTLLALRRRVRRSE